MKHIKLTIAYDGTNYCGWQRQKNALTVEETINIACNKLFNQEVRLTGASRTDSGVHAMGQVAVITVNTTIPTKKISYALNSKLPQDIKIQKAEEVDESFHPRYNCKSKTYQYLIYNAPIEMPLYSQYMAFESRKLDIDAMRQATQYFIGKHDFKAFCTVGSSVKSTIRTIYKIHLSFDNNIIRLKIKGDGFLYNMVRIIAGTLIKVGKGKIDPNNIPQIIESKDRNRAGETAPSKGLTLVKIYY